MSCDTEGIRFIDSHTEGEPTRTILSGAPVLGGGSVAEQLERLREQDWFRQSILGEPRGWDALVGALLVPSSRPECAAGVIFLNNTGYLGMCGHGTIGVAVTLHRLGRIGLGRHRLESPVGVVEVDALDAHRVAIQNVPSYRYLKQVRVEVDGLGTVVGDVAWGGNWFFLADARGLTLRLENIEQLTQAASAVRRALEREGITGKDGAVIDHIELCGPPGDPAAHGRNFVLCPGGAYDRSPCGTGTSAKLACLAADGDLAPGETWVQESVIGSRFVGRYVAAEGGRIVPTIEGSAYVYAEGTIVREPGDPFRNGIVGTSV